jgi:transposase-like protein
LHADPADPPRCRANAVKGHGTWDNDRPPVLGVVGRESGKLHLELTAQSRQQDLQPLVVEWTIDTVVVNTDEWMGYNKLPETGRQRSQVKHSRPNSEYARDDDGDGIREVHCNTIEGIWTGVRNFLRPFRGVNKSYLKAYLAIFEWGYNLKIATAEFFQALLGRTPSTSQQT